YSADKATEWVPIIPGTDGAVILAMCNVILNEIGIWDSEYLKTKTNAPYLVDPESRHYVRDLETHRPLIWDAGESKAKTFDDPTIVDYALEGTFKVHGLNCHPSFHLFKEHLKKYTPQMASKVSSVPAETIRRIATEFAQAAQVGSTITIEDHQLPFRPVASVTFRGAEGHGNATHTVMAVCLLNQILGAADVPGGAVGLPNTCLGHPETGNLKFGVLEGPDGLMSISKWFSSHTPWPVKDPKFPSDGGLQELFSLASSSSVWIAEDQEEIWRKIGLSYRIEVMLNFGCNSVLGTANPERQAEFLKKIPFIVSWDLVANEFAEGFSDFLLPDTSYLETLNWMDGQGFFFNYPYGMDPWCCHITQPVVNPQPSRRYIIDVCFELLDRLGKRAELNHYWNKYIGLDEAEKFNPTEKVTWEQVGDRALRHFFGPGHGWEWFKKHGGLIWPKKDEEAYWRCFTKVRVPIYLEFMADQKKKIKKIADEIGIKMDWEQYTPFISWYPCEPHQVKDPQYDLFCFAYRDIIHTGSCTMEQPWLDEASQMNPYTYSITMNKDTGEQKGLKDKDWVEIESVYGHKVRGILKLRRGQHPQTISLVSAGHWAKGQPIAKNKGSRFTPLLETWFEKCDPLTLNIETCVKVKINKIERLPNDTMGNGD
ncbi:MAG: molybdopterin-dependent oxidoreductase, partial [Pseudomonadota bacterium]